MKRRIWVFAVCALILIGIMACLSSSKPPHTGAFLKEGSKLIEMTTFQGGPDANTTEGIPSTTNRKPIIVFYEPQANLEYLTMYNYYANGQVEYTTNPKDNGLYELQPTSELQDGQYCLYAGDPMMPDALINQWCFRVGN